MNAHSVSSLGFKGFSVSAYATARRRLLITLASLSLLACAGAVWGQSADDADVALQRAIRVEMVDGDLNTAIEMFRDIVDRFPSERPIVAEALLHIGLAYEKLGSREAERVYRDLLSEYPEQRDVADRARQRLAVLIPAAQGESNGLVARRLWQTRGDWIPPGALSPDGLEIAFVQWTDYCCANSGDLGIFDTRTGEYRIVGKTLSERDEGGDTYVLAAAWSPGGDRVAYSEWAPTWDHQVIHVVDADGTDHRIVSDNQQNQRIVPRAWSPDGSWILAIMRGWDDVWRIATVSMEDGTVSVLKTLRQGQLAVASGTLSLSPDGQFVAYAYSTSALNEPDIHVLAVDGSAETVIAPNPTSDLDPLWTPDGSHLVFLSGRSGSPDLWAVEMDEGRAVGDAGVIQPHFGADALIGFTAEGALSYRTDVPESSLKIVTLERDGTLSDGVPLSDRFVGYNSRATLSPDGSQVAYLSTRPAVGLDRARFLVVKSLEDGSERDYEFPASIAFNRLTRPAWSIDGREILFRATDIERTETGATRRQAAYRLEIESGERTRVPYLWDYAGFWGMGTARIVSGRQSARLRELGVRLLGSHVDDIQAITSEDSPLRPGELLLGPRGGWGWVRFTDCDPEASYENTFCGFGGRGLKEFNGPPIVAGRYALSPAGDRLAAIGVDEDSLNLYLIPVTLEGEPKLLVSHPRPDNGASSVVRWTPDGKQLIYGFGPPFEGDLLDEVFRIAVDGGDPQPLQWQISRAQLGDMTFYPQAERAILPVGNFTGRTELWTLSGFPWDETRRD